MTIPIIGGTRIIAKKMIIAERYRVYFKGFLEESLFIAFQSLLSTAPLLSFRVVLLQEREFGCSTILAVT